MSLNITQPLPGLTPSPTGPGAGPSPTKPPQETDFHDRMNATNADSTKVNEAQSAKEPSKIDSVNSTDAASKARNGAPEVERVKGDVEIPKQGDLFANYDHLHKDFKTFIKESAKVDKQIADGKLKPNDPKVVAHRQTEMRELLHFQVEMQGASMKVEIASKLVEHATSGLKTVISTQA